MLRKQPVTVTMGDLISKAFAVKRQVAFAQAHLARHEPRLCAVVSLFSLACGLPTAVSMVGGL